MKILEEISYTSQSIPSNNPSPVTALQGIIAQCLVVISSNSKNFFISSQFSAPSISYLLQKIKSEAPTSFSYFKILKSSFLQSDNLNLSELSTTQMRPSVCSK